MDYAPDKCGVSGTECIGKVWTDVNASDVIFTPEQQQVYTAPDGVDVVGVDTIRLHM